MLEEGDELTGNFICWKRVWRDLCWDVEEFPNLGGLDSNFFFMEVAYDFLGVWHLAFLVNMEG